MQEVEQPTKGHANHKQARIYDVMHDFYEEMKETIGINKQFVVKAKDNTSNEAFAKLRPLVPY